MRGVCLAWLWVACSAPAAPLSDAQVDGADDVEGPRRTFVPRCADAPTPSEGRCNGSAALCAKRFDEVAYATTHNSFASTELGFTVAANHTFGVARQLRDGVRGLMLDTYPGNGPNELWLCHGACALGRVDARETLAAVGEFLDCNRGEVVTIILESRGPQLETIHAFEDAGLVRWLHTQPRDTPWPTLQTMIDNDTRLVVFSDALQDQATFERAPWLHHTYDYAWENPFRAMNPQALSCAVDRGTRSRSLWVFNHFLTGFVGSAELAAMINPAPFFFERVQRCRAETADLPNFVTVDFYESGALFDVVRALNESQ